MAKGVRSLKLIEVAIVLLVLVGISAVLLPSLRRAKMSRFMSRMATGPQSVLEMYENKGRVVAAGRPAPPPKALAHVKSFTAVITLTPRLSVGTASPESIYEVNFEADISAIGPDPGRVDSQIRLPLPPQIISLADLNVSVNGEPSDEVTIQDGALVWSGQLGSDKAVPIKVRYSAVGKGIYTLNQPPGKIIDHYETTLTAKGTNVQMLELSLQPISVKRQSGDTVYAWKYERLMLARPISLDVLGIAPMDRLGELVWLAPLSVLIFGVLVALVAMAYYPEQLDKWMLLLIVGTFAGAFPLVYFAQEGAPLLPAIIGSSALVLAIIGVRAVTLMGLRVGLLGVVLLAAAVFTITFWAALEPARQGVLITLWTIGAFVLAMILLPKARQAMAALAPPAPPPISA